MNAAAVAAARRGELARPLVIDLDGTLVRSDLLHESIVRLVFRKPELLWAMLQWLLRGKAFFKQQVASQTQLDTDTLPYEPALVDWIRGERESGRSVVLCTASDSRYAEQVAKATGLFDDVMASDGTTNLSAHHKADALVQRYGRGGFDYAGNSRADIPVWSVSHSAIVVGAGASIRAAAANVAPVEREIARPAPPWRAWVSALRLRQWVKNVLVFLPLVGAHQFTNLPMAITVALATLAFCLCASSVYLVNDLLDIESDRRHPRKRLRPFAAGVLSIPQGLVVSLLLVVAAFGLAFGGVNLEFAAWLAAYLAVTACYSFWLKRKMLVDSLVLAGLYTLRVLAGGAAAGLPPGFWLLAFSMFLFLSLALVKRYSELRQTFLRGRARTPGRDYMVEDLPLVEMLGIASGFTAVLVLAMYINGDTVTRLYPHQQLIWLTVPVMLYWVSRLWLKAHRGELDDDPIVFALRDRLSQVTILLFFGALLLASLT
ncbi:MAG TPA: UbiA family prenyltransferase [Burkholderiaceae bacterium]|nr:UbiA family prenyltransferase [Burkholderiaceae bacterium]